MVNFQVLAFKFLSLWTRWKGSLRILKNRTLFGRKLVRSSNNKDCLRITWKCKRLAFTQSIYLFGFVLLSYGFLGLELLAFLSGLLFITFWWLVCKGLMKVPATLCYKFRGCDCLSVRAQLKFQLHYEDEGNMIWIIDLIFFFHHCWKLFQVSQIILVAQPFGLNGSKRCTLWSSKLRCCCFPHAQ